MKNHVLVGFESDTLQRRLFCALSPRLQVLVFGWARLSSGQLRGHQEQRTQWVCMVSFVLLVFTNRPASTAHAYRLHKHSSLHRISNHLDEASAWRGWL